MTIFYAILRLYSSGYHLKYICIVVRVASEAKGVVLTDEDKDYHKKFSSGKYVR